MREDFNYIIFHVEIQLFQHHLSPVSGLNIPVINPFPLDIWVYFWILDATPSICVCLYASTILF